MKTFLGWLGAVLLFLGTAFMYLTGLVVASFRGDQLVAVYALQWGAIVLGLLLVVAVVARAKRNPMRPWLVGLRRTDYRSAPSHHRQLAHRR